MRSRVGNKRVGNVRYSSSIVLVASEVICQIERADIGSCNLARGDSLELPNLVLVCLQTAMLKPIVTWTWEYYLPCVYG